MTAGGSANKIVEELRSGNARFINGQTAQSAQSSLNKLKQFAVHGQFPKAIVLCCSDSRAPVEMVFDQDIGDLFVIRVAGNIVAPSLVGSVEYAADAYAVKLAVVMGHTRCGAVTAALHYAATGVPVDSINIHDIVSRIKPHVIAIAQREDLSFDEKLSLAVEANVVASMSQLATSSSLIEQLIEQGRLYIKGAVLELDTGIVTFLDSQRPLPQTEGSHNDKACK